MIDQIAIRKVLVISTSHVPQHVAKWLDEQGMLEAEHRFGTRYGDIPVASHKHGWVIRIEQDPWRGTPAELLAVLDKARELDCGWVDLDGDGDKIDGLPTWEW